MAYFRRRRRRFGGRRRFRGRRTFKRFYRRRRYGRYRMKRSKFSMRRLLRGGTKYDDYSFVKHIDIEGVHAASPLDPLHDCTNFAQSGVVLQVATVSNQVQVTGVRLKLLFNMPDEILENPESIPEMSNGLIGTYAPWLGKNASAHAFRILVVADQRGFIEDPGSSASGPSIIQAPKLDQILQLSGTFSDIWLAPQRRFELKEVRDFIILKDKRVVLTRAAQLYGASNFQVTGDPEATTQGWHGGCITGKQFAYRKEFIKLRRKRGYQAQGGDAPDYRGFGRVWLYIISTAPVSHAESEKPFVAGVIRTYWRDGVGAFAN